MKLISLASEQRTDPGLPDQPQAMKPLRPSLPLPLHGAATSGHKFKYGWSTLHSDLQQAGFVDIHSEAVANDRLPELRPAISMTNVGAYRGILLAFAKKGISGSPAEDEVERMFEAATRATTNGAYYQWNIWVWTGRRPKGLGR